jgi:hypothetical protein
MIATLELIDLLARRLEPVHRLRPPVVRAGCWLLVAMTVLALLAISQGLRPDLAQCWREISFTTSLAASFATGLFAVVAAFMLVVPGRSRLWLLLPVPPLLLWLSTVGYQCLTNWVRVDPTGMSMGETTRCFATLILASLPLWLLMLQMLRRARPIQAGPPMLAGSLAVAATTAVAMNLIHQFDATAMILLWNFGGGAIIVGVSALLSRPMLAVCTHLPR